MSAYLQYDFSTTNFIKPNVIKNIGSGSTLYNGIAINNPTMNNIGPTPQIMSALFNSTTQQYISIPAFSTTNNGLSFAFWFKSNENITWARIFDFGNGSGSDNIVVFINQGAIGFSVYVGFNNSYQPGNNQVIPAMNNNTWNHIVWTMNPANNNQWVIYLNGKVQNIYQNAYYPNSIVRNLNYIGRSNWPTDPYFTGNVADFRMYNSVLSASSVSSIYKGDLIAQVSGALPPPPLLNGYNQLYNQIFCNLFQSTINNGFSTCDNCDFSFNNANNVLSTSSTGGVQQCLNLCANNQYCTAYTHYGNNSPNTGSNNCILYGANDQYPIQINTGVVGSYSGYAVTAPKASYNYNNLNNNQKNNVQLKCATQYLNKTFTPEISTIDISNCLSFSNQNNTTEINANPECIFNIYQQNGGPVNYNSTANYINKSNIKTGSNGDVNITDYEYAYNQYNKLKTQNSNINDILASSDNKNYPQYFSTINTNYDTLSNNFLENINSQGTQLSNVSSQISKKIGGNIETFNNKNEYIQNEYIQNEYIQNEYIQNEYNKNNNKLLIIILIILIIFFILIFLFKKK